MSFFLRNRRLLFVILAIVVFLAGGGAWYYYSQVVPTQALPAEETIRTTRVRRGDLVITASGTGTLIPATEGNLGFSTGGVLAEVSVEVGDRVEAGEKLARLDDTDARSEVTQAEISLRLAGYYEMTHSRNDLIRFLRDQLVGSQSWFESVALSCYSSNFR